MRSTWIDASEVPTTMLSPYELLPPYLPK